MPNNNQNSYHLSALGKTYELKRYPFNPKSQLKAWDAADEYLLSEIQDLLRDTTRLCIVNDNFGTLSTVLSEYHPVCYGDSWMSREAMRRNREANDIEHAPSFEPNIKDLVQNKAKPNLIIGRVPKSKAQLSYMLNQLCRWVEPGCQLFLAGMDKHLSKGQFDLIDKYFGTARFLPGVKKARIWHAEVDKSKGEQEIRNSSIKVDGFDLTLDAAPNVFSQDRLDIGSRFFLESFNLLPKQARVADLACGAGILGLAYLRLHPEASMYFCDESFQAVQSTQANLSRHFPQAKTTAKADDGLQTQAANSFDLVLCNPPFHQQNTVSTEIAEQLFKDARRCMNKEGELWIVANRHLNYHQILKRLFNNCVTVTSNNKFVILKSVKN